MYKQLPSKNQKENNASLNSKTSNNKVGSFNFKIPITSTDRTQSRLQNNVPVQLKTNTNHWTELDDSFLNLVDMSNIENRSKQATTSKAAVESRILPTKQFILKEQNLYENSPDKLNTALLESEPDNFYISKRKSSEITGNTSKKRLSNCSYEELFGDKSNTRVNNAQDELRPNLDMHHPNEYSDQNIFNDDIPLLDDDYFKTQFIKQIDNATELAESKLKKPENYDFNLSQMFEESQFQNEPLQIHSQQSTAGQNTTVTPALETSPIIPKTSVAPVANAMPQTSNTVNNKLNLTQMFLDDEDDFITTIDVCQSSQQFLTDIRNTCTNINKLKNIDPNCTIYKSKNASEYIALQRSMHDENEDNLNDDNYLDSDLSQAYRSSQYRREIEAEFDECETSITNLDNILDTNINHVEIENTTAAGDDEVVAEIQDITWTSDFGTSPVRQPKGPLVTPTSIVRQRLSVMYNPKKDSPKNVYDINTKAMTPVTSSAFFSLGPYFGLPNKVRILVKEFKGIEHLYDWQKECLTLPAIPRRNNLIYALPTSGGKTLVAEILILREILCRRKNCIFILPYVSIVQEKIWALSPFAVQLDFLLEEYAAGKGALPPRKRRKKKSVYIATIEKGLSLLDSLIEADRANEIGLIVVDELHIIGDSSRGAVLETLLTKTMFINAGIQIVGMSATIGNLNEIAKFLSADVYTRDFRPVELKEYIKCGSDILEFNSNAASVKDAFVPVRTVNFGYRDEVTKMDPDHLAGLVCEVIPENSCLIFCPSKMNCENVALLLSQLLPKKYLEHKKDEKTQLKQAIESDAGPMCSTLAQTLPFGIAYHHSGLTADERRHLEDAYRQNIITVICCTSTLAAGVNLPAKRVILRSPYIGKDFITLSKYKQMAGRAGRAGMGDAGESIIICAPKDNLRISNLLCAPMDEAASSMHLDDCKGLRNLVLSAIGLNLASCRGDLQKLTSKTLLAVQADRLDINTNILTDKVIQNLFQQKAMSITTVNTTINMSDVVFASQDRDTYEIPGKSKKNYIIKPSTPLEISKLGKASFKSCIDLNKAKIIYKDLVQAQNSLVLFDYMHLLYIVTPYEPADVNVYPDMGIYYSQYSKLCSNHLHIARTLGITESCAMKFISGKPITKPDLARVVNRFFFTLVLHELWQHKPVHEVAELFHINRGVVQNLMTASAAYASGVLKLCEELDEFWAFKELLGILTKRLSYCCAVELIPLMNLPCVKLARAKQLYSVGYKSLEDVAKSSVKDLVDSVEYMTIRVARQLISAAKVLLLEKVETLREEVQDCLDVLERRK